METIFNKIKKLAKKQRLSQGQVHNIHLDMSYITEEVGELAKDLVDGDLKHAKDEAADVAITALSMYSRLGGSYDELNKIIAKQLKKWERSIK